MAETRTITKTLKLYTPHEKQLELHKSKARYKVASWGRQSGKSTWAVNELLSKAWTNPKQTFWFLSPTYDQAKVQFQRTINALWTCPAVIKAKNQTELMVQLQSESKVVFKSGEVLDNLRGETLNGAIVDEMRDQHKDLWPMVIRPMLATTQGWASFISTPRGFDAFYDMAETARLDTTGRYLFVRAPSTCNPLFTQEEFEAARKDMSEAQFAQEILAEFRDITTGKAYINYTSANESLYCPFNPGHLLSPYLPVCIGPDFNLNPMAWSIGQNKADDWYFFDEVWLPNSHTQEASEVLIEKLLAYKETGYLKANPQVIVAGDATAKSGQRAAAGQSDYDILFKALTDAKITWVNRTPESNPHVKDRVNTVNTKCRSADESIHFWLHPVQCKMTKRDMERVVWKQGTSIILDQTTNTELTHISDGVGYLICAITPLQGVRQVGKLKVIIR